jgi:hypothetical protein
VRYGGSSRPVIECEINVSRPESAPGGNGFDNLVAPKKVGRKCHDAVLPDVKRGPERVRANAVVRERANLRFIDDEQEWLSLLIDLLENFTQSGCSA